MPPLNAPTAVTVSKFDLSTQEDGAVPEWRQRIWRFPQTAKKSVPHGEAYVVHRGDGGPHQSPAKAR